MKRKFKRTAFIYRILCNIINIILKLDQSFHKPLNCVLTDCALFVDH